MPEPGPRKRLARNPAKAVQAPIVQIPAVQKASREQEKGRGQEKSRIKKIKARYITDLGLFNIIISFFLY